MCEGLRLLKPSRRRCRSRGSDLRIARFPGRGTLSLKPLARLIRALVHRPEYRALGTCKVHVVWLV